jgi:hypothetical protein
MNFPKDSLSSARGLNTRIVVKGKKKGKEKEEEKRKEKSFPMCSCKKITAGLWLDRQSSLGFTRFQGIESLHVRFSEGTYVEISYQTHTLAWSCNSLVTSNIGSKMCSCSAPRILIPSVKT